MKQLALALAITAVAGSAFAQAGATVTSVNGLVTMSSGNQLVNVTPGMPLPTGGQLLTSGSGSVTVQFASGCTAILAPGQSMPVTEAACAQNVAARGAGGGAGGSGGGVFAGGNGLLLAGGGVAALAYNVNQNRKGNGATVITPTQPGTPAVVVTPTPPRRPISRS
ncbi:hypothetical protein [Hydrogenophaga taeniospiralis]|uniref:hypothetical protein n=1 Tax=Hydrogenophaga taeniospiralis TaxID=65656 RepID=UPI001CFC21D0|nr:hypothetical protein [Hydrogenophaga taeniospiralis]UCU94189.1 hypothetical protein KI616_26210 [Hydrogenophaga taeniospiralis]